jgi:hypothetical protein
MRAAFPNTPAILLALIAGGTTDAGFQLDGSVAGGRDHPAADYHSPHTDNPITDLNARLEEGSVKLEPTVESGFLR